MTEASTAPWAGLALLALALQVGCVEGRVCPAGYRTDGPACVPIFDHPDDCPGANEMPVRGGGCGTVGVTGCATGFRADGAGGCEPVLPDQACPPGTLELIGETACQPVGVTRCATGFLGDGTGGCEPVLPDQACPPGTLELIGHDTCEPVGDCGPDAEPWGLIAVDATTVYVDAAADALGADGTVARPYPTVTAAVAAAPPGGQVAIAAGDYEEAPTLGRPVRLVGRCSALVTLRGRLQAAEPAPAVTLTAGGTGSEVRGVTLTGPGVGLQVTGARLVVVEAVEIQDTGSQGVALGDGAEATIRRAKLSGCTTNGISALDSTVRAEQVVVQGTRPDPTNGEAGSGIIAECTTPDRCGSLLVEGSLVTGNRRAGIISIGVAARVRSSVVRDTLPRESDQADGEGIIAACNGSGVCGSQVVDGSLVTGNRAAGIRAYGGEARVRSCVVRDTLPQESDQRLGQGIIAQCDPASGTCAALRVEGSLVTGNRTAGILAHGVEATVRSSLVRDTLPRALDRLYGEGIIGQCFPAVGACASLVVDRCLLHGNRTEGISALGVEATIRSSVVRDTLPQESDQNLGRGISSFCDPDLGVCGSLLVDRTTLSGNRTEGIAVYGVETTIRSSVVRDTLPQESDQNLGTGVFAGCDLVAGVCGNLLLEGSLVAANRSTGVLLVGIHALIRSSVVRDTQAQTSDQQFGNGVVTACDRDGGVCGSLLVESCLVSGNRTVGILADGVDTTVRSSVVRDTRAQESDQRFGRGVYAQCGLDGGVCGDLRVERSLVAGSHEVGIFPRGVEATIRSSVVRDTWAQESDQRFGRGINAQCSALGVCGGLEVEATLVTRSESIGIYSTVSATLIGVAVVDSGVNAEGLRVAEYGHGIWMGCSPEACVGKVVLYSLVSSSHGAGLATSAVPAVIHRSVIDSVHATPGEGKYGYGVQVAGRTDAQRLSAAVAIQGCVIRDARLAGVLYTNGAVGTMETSVVTGSEYCVAKNEGTSPTILDDNSLSCSVRSEPGWVSLSPAPAPPPATPEVPVSE